MITALILLLVALVALGIWFYRLMNKNKSFYANIPIPPTIPFFGNIFEVASTKDVLDVLLKYAKNYEGIFKIHLGPIRKVLVVSDYKFLEFVLSSTKILNKPYDYNFLRPWLGTGLLTSDGRKSAEMSVIAKRRKELENKKKEIHDTHNTVVTKNKKVFLDLLLEATVDGKPLTQEEIREEVDTFMFEGHDTIASAISFALFSIANHPNVQKRIYEEQHALFGENKNPVITYASLQSMKYLEQVIKETLRLYPSVPFYGRQTKEAVEYNGTIIPEGITILILAFGIHRNSKYFEEPEKFNPDRFENVDGKTPYAYIPFSAGPRNCIGQKFAMLEMKSTLSKIIRHFELGPAIPQHKLQLAAESVLKSINGIKIGLKKRF
ncbi:p450 domain containing protein [Asbolus verrucosus]|uniref:p450 domain containing protein n=1 Tax=Asbolus verrucosus TaxID=1661398 RepID=A0A482VX74_ASBVE|nr:p450 domain containing protein [Asbolus verrucosus]